MKTGSRAPDWEDLRCFAAVARYGGLSPAARALGVSHATVGRRLERLTAALGAALFDRSGDRFMPTDAGRAALERVAAMEAAAHGLTGADLTDPPADKSEISGLARLTAPRGLADLWLAPRLADLARRHPRIDVALAGDSRALSLSRREADVALRLAEPKDGDFIARKLRRMTYGLYVAADGWDGSRYVAYEDESLPETGWLRRWEQRRPPGGRRAVLRADSLTAQLAACRAGVGAALLPRYLAAACPDLIETPPLEPPLERGVWLLTRRRSSQNSATDNRAAQAVADWLVDLFDCEGGAFDAPSRAPGLGPNPAANPAAG